MSDTDTSLSAQGTGIGYSPTNTGTPVYTDVVNVSEISGFDGSATEIDTTNLKSKGKEKRMGLQDWGNVTLTTNINLQEASHAALLAAKKAGTLLYWQVTLSDSTKITFAAYVKSFPISAKVDTVYSGSIALTITGDITVAVAGA